MRSFQIALLIMVPTAVIVWAMAYLSGNPEMRNYQPWKVSVNAEQQVSVFGITLGETSILEAKELLDANPKMGILKPKDKPMVLEVDYQEHSMGGITGRLIAAISVDDSELKGAAERNIKRTLLESGTVKMVPRRDDALALLDNKLVGLTFIPIVDLPADFIEKYFGKPTTVYVTGEGFEHWVYEDKFLDILISDHGLEVMQYAMPEDFDEKLVQPVIAEAERYRRGEL